MWSAGLYHKGVNMGLAYIEGAGGGGVRSSDVTASAADILTGKYDLTAESDDEVVQGSMPNNGTVNHSLPINGSFTIAQGYHSGSGKVTQNITTKAAGTYYATTSDQTISAGQYLSGAQTIKKLTQTNLTGANIKPGVTISINNGNGNVWSVAGTMASKAAATYYATTSDQTISSGQYLSGAQTIKKLTQSNLSSANILRGKTITINNGNANVWSVTGSTNVLKTSVVQVNSGLSRAGFQLRDANTQSTTTYYMFYKDINPGMTPALAFCLAGEMFFWREPNAFFNMIANDGATGGRFSMTGFFVNASDAPFTSTTLRAFFPSSYGGYVRIFGY